MNFPSEENMRRTERQWKANFNELERRWAAMAPQSRGEAIFQKFCLIGCIVITVGGPLLCVAIELYRQLK